MSTRIYWTEAETAQVVEEAARTWLRDPLMNITPVLQRAQLVLPPERRRPWHTVQVKDPVVQAIRAKVNELTTNLTPSTPPPPPPTIDEILKTASFEQLVQTFFDKLEETVLHRLTPLTVPGIVASRVEAPLHISNGRPLKKRLRIGVIGLLPDQQEAVRNRINGNAELVFLRKDAYPNNVPPKLDACIVHRHTRHYWWEWARTHYPPNRVAFLDGGISKVTEQIREWVQC
jgi:hypothetical protein